jgi:hypothetical protein
MTQVVEHLHPEFKLQFKKKRREGGREEGREREKETERMTFSKQFCESTPSDDYRPDLFFE